jgi:hypothetical protein
MDEPDAVAGEWARAKAKGMAEAARGCILTVLRHRFLSGTLIPHEFVEALDAETDVDQLKRWFDEASRAFSLKDFLLRWRASRGGSSSSLPALAGGEETLPSSGPPSNGL